MKTYLALLLTVLIVPSVHASTLSCADAQPNQDSIQDTVVGAGEMALPGKNLTVHYVGTFCDGKIFDSSIKRHQPFTFTLGAKQVIKGWEQGFDHMQVGGKRRIVIPAALAYGANAVGSIPANSILIFDVELLGVN